MNLRNQIRVALGLKVALAVQEKLVDGTIIVSTADVLEAGSDVSILVEDGTTILLAPGEYELEMGGGFIVVDEGVISEMIDAEEEVVEEEVVEEEVALSKKVAKAKAPKFSQEQLITAISSVVGKLLNENKKELAKLSKQIKDLSNAPATNDIKVNKFSKSNIQPLTRAQINSMSISDRIRYNISISK